MTKPRRASVNAIGKKLLQQNDEKQECDIRNAMRELQGKLKMKEKRLASDRAKHEQTRTKNETKILEMRAGNSHLRGIVHKALEADEFVVSEVLSNRKRQRLALKGKSGEEAIKELDQNVCDLARRLNDISHTKKKRQQKYLDLQKQLFFKSRGTKDEPTLSSRARQLENSIDKVAMKTTTAFQLQGLYKEIKRTSEDELRSYPKLLDNLEKHILSQRTELLSLQEMEQAAISELDVATQQKLDLERAVREDRREREVTIRAMRSKVKEVARLVDLPQTRGRPTRQSEDEQRLEVRARRTYEMLEKIKEYQDKASKLEVVTGIPFSNKENLINCFRNQKNSSKVLRAQTTQNRNVIAKKKKALAELQSKYIQMLHEHEMSLEEQIKRKQQMMEGAKERRQRSYVTNSNASELLKSIRCWLKPIATKLLLSCQNLKLENMNSQIWKAKDYFLPNNPTKDGNVGKLFAIFSDLLVATNREAHRRPLDLTHDQEDANSKSEDSLVSNDNNRILPTLERKVSEDFDYNTPNNEEYLSRATIKRQAESRQRGKRQ